MHEQEQLKSLIHTFLEGSTDRFPQLSEDSLTALYGLACKYYENGKYGEAADFFKFLTYANAFERKYWLALGAANQMLKKYPEAIEYYSVAAVQDPKDPYVHLHAADCFLALGQIDKARIALDSAQKTAQLDQKHTDLLSHLTLIQKAWANKEKVI